jgi:hypothetical protein
MRKDIEAELHRLGVTQYRFTLTTGGHQLLEFWIGARRCHHVFAATPSDWRGTRNTIGDVRRLIRGRALDQGRTAQ